jgi:GT2 family glycosyltransferase
MRQVNLIGIVATHIRSPQRGAGAARNRCLEQVCTEFAAATDDDCIVTPDWLEKLACYLRQQRHCIVTGRVEPGGEGVVPSTITFEKARVYDKPLLSFDVLYTGNFGLAKATADRIGPFDESPQLFPAEDNEWQYRALRAGTSIHYVPDIAVVHLDWRSAEGQLELYQRYARGQGFFFGKHIRRGDWFVLLRATYSLGRGGVRWLRGLVSRDADLKASGRAGVVDLARGIRVGLRHGAPLAAKDAPTGARS